MKILKDAIDHLEAGGGTAIGEAIIAGKRQLNQAGKKKNYIIVITDGENTEGRQPIDAVKAIRALPEEQQPGIYLVAFDIEAREFDDLKNQGVLVVEARSADSLQETLDYILYQKILVEKPL